MIKALFLKTVNMSITASVVIMAVMVIRWLLRKQPKIYSYMLWGIVLFRLLCPYSISLDTSLFNFIPPAQITGGQIEYVTEDIVYAPQIQAEVESSTNVSPVLPEQTVTAPAQPEENMIVVAPETEIDWISAVAIVWFLGAIYMLLNNLISLYEVRMILNESSHLQDNVYICSAIPTAFIMGIVKPKIYLPANLTDKQKEFILLHEQTHIHRRDYLFKILSFAAVAIHWFNPLVWLAFNLAENDMEMACDEAVIKKLGNSEKAGYSQTLLNISMPKPKQPAMHLAFGEGDTKERILNILNYKKHGMIYAGIAVTGIFICSVMLLTNPVSSAYRQIGIKEKDISTAVFVSGDKYLQLPEVANNTVIENLKKIRLSPVENETTEEKGNHFIFISTDENKYYINFSEDFTKIWVLADDYGNNGKLFTVDNPEIFKGLITGNIEANWDENNAEASDTVFWVNPNMQEREIMWKTADTYLSNLLKDTNYLISGIQICSAENTPDLQYEDTFEYNTDIFDNYNYVVNVKYYTLTASSAIQNTIIYIKQINDNNYQIIGSYDDNDTPDLQPDGITTDIEEYVREIPYSEIEVKNHTMILGTQETVTEGKNGLYVEKVKLHYDENNNIIKTELLDATVLYESQPQEIHRGIVWNGQVITGGSGKLSWPTAAGYVSRGFVGQYPEHNGIDIAGPMDTYIYAADNGVVTKALYTNVGYGIYCIIEHGGYQTLYAHCSELLVKTGQQVQKGQIIAYMGATGNTTGNNLHFEVKKGNTRYNPYSWF